MLTRVCAIKIKILGQRRQNLPLKKAIFDENLKFFLKEKSKKPRRKEFFYEIKIFFFSRRKNFFKFEIFKKHTKTRKNKNKKIGFCKVFKRKNRKFLLKNPLKK